MALKEDCFLKTKSPRRHHWLVLQMCAIVTVISLLYYACVQREVVVERNPLASPGWNISRILSRAVNKFHSAIAGFPDKKKKQKLVLLWTPYYSSNDWIPPAGDLHCPVDDCFTTTDRRLLQNSSAVVIHWRNADPNDMPQCLDATSCPLLVLFNKEAPIYTPREAIAPINDKVHWTATYRRDSDLNALYGKIEKRKDAFQMPEYRPDRELVCWLVSHCNTPSHREVYVAKLKSYVDVQIYGQCGEMECPFEGRIECYRWMSKRCMFYLSFENSLCTDYLTEKLFFALETDMVPVVLGGVDYSLFLPNRSFINAADFPSPKDLAAYLVSLSKDKASYLSYFEWKKKYFSKDMAYLWFCDLCAKLHTIDPATVNPHKDVSSWWFNQSRCTSWEDDENLLQVL